MATRNPQLSAGRPSISVVVPFRGDHAGANRMIAALDRLDLRDGDEAVVADNTADGRNPLCGDALRVYVEMEGDTVSDVSFKGSGCAISSC